MSLELLLERGQRAIALLGQLLNRDIAEDMRVDYLLEIVTCRIDIIQYFALKAAVIQFLERETTLYLEN